MAQRCFAGKSQRQQSEICVKFSVFHTVFDVKLLVKFSLAHPNPGKRCTENFTKFSRQISRRLWQKKIEKTFISHFRCRARKRAQSLTF